MLLYVISFAFGCLVVINYVISRSMLFPATLFAATWAVSLAALAVVQDSFYPISPETLAIYLAGALAFTAGSILLSGIMPARPRMYKHLEGRRANARLLLDIALVVCILCLPLYVHRATAQFGGWRTPGLFMLIRQQAVENSPIGFKAMANLETLARLVLYGMCLEHDGTRGRRVRAYAAVFLALPYGLLTGSKDIMVSAVLIPFLVEAVKINKVRLKQAILVAIAGAVLFASGLLLINYRWAAPTSPAERMWQLAHAVEGYWLGGLVAFDRTVQSPSAIASTQNVSRVFLEAARNYGARVSVPSLHAGYTSLSAHAAIEDTNLYTIYFSYYKDPGWLGMITLMILVGAICTFVYNVAQSTWPVAVVWYAILAHATIFSFQADHYFLGLNFMVKASVFFILLYHSPQVVCLSARLNKRLIYRAHPNLQPQAHRSECIQ